MNIQESIIDTTEICQVNDGLRFQYDPAKNMLKPVTPKKLEKNVDGVITRYVYDRGNIHLEYDGNNKFQAKYVHSDNVDEPLRMESPDNPYRNEKFPVQEFYYHRDRLGNITEITDFEGTVVQRYVYDAFGKVSIFDKDGNAITPESAKYLKSPYAFTGREYDPETGMYYHRERYRDPESGIFISEEPLGIDGPNLYWYTLNNPMNYVDPTGLLSLDQVKRIGIGAGKVVIGGALAVGGVSAGALISSGSGSLATPVGVAVGIAGVTVGGAIAYSGLKDIRSAFVEDTLGGNVIQDIQSVFVGNALASDVAVTEPRKNICLRRGEDK